ncbi:hypothetical protein ACH4MM_35655 [Streptomyces pratensis]|uniref:rhamnogalacturonan lyase family protein n=1 Tax=Streptomyces pratensis TaxID=1169025 RepID=UPI0037A90382
MELLNNGKPEKWNPESPAPSNSLPRVLTTSKFGATGVGSAGNPTSVGDIMGDLREEAVYTDADHDELIVFTTDRPTDTRLYTLAHNPAYRNDMTVKGYMRSHEVDYFLGHGMNEPRGRTSSTLRGPIDGYREAGVPASGTTTTRVWPSSWPNPRDTSSAWCSTTDRPRPPAFPARRPPSPAPRESSATERPRRGTAGDVPGTVSCRYRRTEAVPSPARS